MARACLPSGASGCGWRSWQARAAPSNRRARG
jgi:hypothetical protein